VNKLKIVEPQCMFGCTYPAFDRYQTT